MNINEISQYSRIIKNVLTYFIIASIFITGEGFEMNIGFLVYWYHFIYLPFIVYCLLTYHRVSAKVLLTFMVIVVFSLLTYKVGINLVIKQLINIGLSTIVFYNLIVHEKYNFEEVFRKYIVFSKIVLILGLLQVLLFYAGWGNYFRNAFPFLWETNMTFRLQSITDEPSFIALTFVPVVFLSLYNLFYRRTYLLGRSWAYLFVLGYVLTLSTVAFLGVIIMLLLLYFKNFSVKKLAFSLVAFFCIFYLGFFIYSNVDFVKLRLDDTLYGVNHDITNEKTYKRIIVSSYAFLSNWFVTKQSIRENPITGTGLGTHELNYDRYLPSDMLNYLDLNRMDANSMGLRLLSETGIVGFSFFCFFVVKFKIRSRPFFSRHEEMIWILNAGIFVFILLA